MGRMSSPTVVIVPGWRNTGPGHWQSLWCARLPRVVRVRQDDWVSPLRHAWVESLTAAIGQAGGPVLVAAHRLGCIAAAHLPAGVQARIGGALLVAPANPEGRAALADFAPVPRRRLPFPSIVVGSTDDPYCPAPLTAEFARAWGGRLVLLEGAGHVNVESGHGEWPQDLALLGELAGRLRPAPPAPLSYALIT